MVTTGAWRHSALACGAMVISTTVLAQWEPTRMQMCEAELVNLAGEARKKTMGECLRRRLEGEKIVERDCKRQVRDVAVDLAGSNRLDLHRQCLRTALQVSYTELPRRPAPAPKPEGGAALVATDGTDTPPPANAQAVTPVVAPASPPPQATAAAVQQ